MTTPLIPMISVSWRDVCWEGTDGLPDIDLQGKQGELDRFIVFSNALPAGIPANVRHRYYYNRSAAAAAASW